jgi:disulfide bond formation protein DsbB
MLTRRQGNGLAACACAAALAFAFYAQYGMGLVPCHLCIFQRVTLAALGLAFLASVFISRPGGRGFSAPRSSGSWASRRLPPRAGMSGSRCSPRAPCRLRRRPRLHAGPLPADGRHPESFKAGGECAKIDWSFLGLSMPAWVLVLAVLLTAFGLWINLRKSA